MIGNLVAWVEKWSSHHHATKALAIVSFVESSFFPIPPFVLIVAMLIHEKKPSWIRLAIVGSLSSVLGGIAGYFIGKFFYGYIGEPLIAWYGLTAQVESLGEVFKAHVFVTILLASLSPLPYKVFTLSAGLFSVSLPIFILASIVGRGIRFFVVSYLADRYGVHAKRFIIKQQKISGAIVLVASLCAIVYFALTSQGIL
jgi:membrane protein YqaA with SNARE-associated domain